MLRFIFGNSLFCRGTIIVTQVIGDTGVQQGGVISPSLIKINMDQLSIFFCKHKLRSCVFK